MAKPRKTRAAAEFIGASARFLEEDRARIARGERGYGPPFRRIGNHCLYDEADLIEWMRSTRVDPRNPVAA
jgi:hypothetical protein